MKKILKKRTLATISAACIVSGCLNADDASCRRPAAPDEIKTAQKIVSDSRFREYPIEVPPFNDYFLVRDVSESSICGAIVTVYYQLNLERADRQTFSERSPPSRIVVNMHDRTYKLELLGEFKKKW